MHVARIAEQVGRAPQQLDAGPLLFLFEHLDDRVEIAVRLGQRGPFGGDIAIVKGVERCPQLLEELKGDPRPVLGILDRVRVPSSQGRTAVPGPNGSEPVPRNVCQ